MVTLLGQLSVAVGVAGGGTTSHCTSMFPGTPDKTGGWVSPTDIIWDAWLEFPQSSKAVQVRVRIEAPGQLPGTEVSLNVMVTSESQLSVATGVAGGGTTSHCTSRSAGTPEKTGPSVSLTVTVCTA